MCVLPQSLCFFSIQVKSVMTYQYPNVLVHKMQGTNGGKDSICWREFMPKQMKCTCRVEDVETVRVYDRVQEK